MARFAFLIRIYKKIKMQKNSEREPLLKSKLTEAAFLQQRVSANLLTAKKKRAQQINERRM